MGPLYWNPSQKVAERKKTAGSRTYLSKWKPSLGSSRSGLEIFDSSLINPRGAGVRPRFAGTSGGLCIRKSMSLSRNPKRVIGETLYSAFRNKRYSDRPFPIQTFTGRLGGPLHILIGRSPAFSPFHHSRASTKARFSCLTDLILKYVSSRQFLLFADPNKRGSVRIRLTGMLRSG